MQTLPTKATPMQTLDGKVALITGGSRGLGAAICETLAAAGATIIAADIRIDQAEQVAQEIRKKGGEAIALPLDITNDDQIATAIQIILDQYEKISKWGLLGLSHALHVEARPFGVKVTAIIAGGMKTPFLLDRFPDINRDVLQDPQKRCQNHSLHFTSASGNRYSRSHRSIHARILLTLIKNAEPASAIGKM